MSAYGAMVSLEHTLSILSPTPTFEQIINKLRLREFTALLQILDKTSKSKCRNKVNALDGRIKQIVCNFEHLLESQSDEREGEGEGEGGLSLTSIDLQSLQNQNDVESFIHTLNNLMEQYVYEVDNMPEEDQDHEDSDQSCIRICTCISSSSTKSKMFGLSDEFEAFHEWLLEEPIECSENIVCVGFVGTAGVGKTTFARKLYQDPQITSHFDFRLWIALGRKSNPRLNQDLRTMLAELKGDEKCLIVLDDAWETQQLPSLLTSFQDMKNTIIIRVLITTRERNVIESVKKTFRSTEHMVLRFLDQDESKDLLCHKLFGENSSICLCICPPQLVKAATKIAKRCEGLPLTIVTVADLISKAQNNDPEYWEDVAEERNSVFKDAYDEISKVLYPSYDYLPVHLKMPFLYLGVFPRDYEIPVSKIINMLTGEGWFLDSILLKQEVNQEDLVTKCLTDLCDFHNLVLWKPKSTRWYFGQGCGRPKSCWLHSSWRYLCREEARKNKFYHVLNRLVDASEKTIQGQHCLCLESNLLFGIREFRNSVRLNSASSFTRSLLFFGPYHQYPTPIDAIGFKLLRELDALQLRFYAFPTQVLALVRLKYLALTCNGQLPSNISKLFNLKTLIIHPHTSITKCCATPSSSSSSSSSSSYIPIEIWDMKELEHVEILGKSLPPPGARDDPNFVVNVKTVVGVNGASICNIPKQVLKGFRHMRKLAVQMEVRPYEVVDHDLILRCFAHISTHNILQTLKCRIINPVLVEHAPSSSSSSSSPRRPLMKLPLILKKLHLSGMGLPWEYMNVVGCLPYLEVLKLRCYAFRGSKWETDKGSFRSLMYLVIEDSDLVEWKAASESFLILNYLSLKHCYKLREFRWPSEARFAKIELVDCNPLAVTCAKKFHREEEEILFKLNS